MSNMPKNQTTGKYELNITPSENTQTKTLRVGGSFCDVDIDVIVNEIPSEYVIPSGEIGINSTGELYVWKNKNWHGTSLFRGRNIWTDGENIYFSNTTEQYVLNKATSTWETKDWGSFDDITGRHVWEFDGNIYFSQGTFQYVFDKNTSTWSEKVWGGLTFFNGHDVWTINNEVAFYSNGTSHYMLVNSTWVEVEWSGLTDFYGRDVWTDGENIYYSGNSGNYVLNKTPSSFSFSWTQKVWTNGFNGEGENIWTDGFNMYYSYGNNQKILDKLTDTWKEKNWINGNNFDGIDIWKDENTIYYSTFLNNSAEQWESYYTPVTDVTNYKYAYAITESKTVTPTTSAQTILPTSGYLIRSVEVGAVNLQVKSTTPTTSSQTITPDNGYIGLSSVEVSAVSNGNFNNVATSGVTYTENTDAGTVIPANGYLYLNEGYFPNTKISLAHIIPDPSTGESNPGTNDIKSGKVAYDGDGNKIIGTMSTVTPTFTGGTPSLTSKSNTISVTGMATSSSTTSYYIDASASAKATRTAVTYANNYTGLIDKASGTEASAAATEANAETINANRVYIKAASPSASVSSYTAPSVSVSGSASGFTASSSATSYYVTVNASASNGSVKAKYQNITAGYQPLEAGVESEATTITPTVSGSGNKVYIPAAGYTANSNNSATNAVDATPGSFPYYVAVSAGYTPKRRIKINAPSNLSAGNIKSGVTIAGVTGNYTGVTPSVSGFTSNDPNYEEYSKWSNNVTIGKNQIAIYGTVGNSSSCSSTHNYSIRENNASGTLLRSSSERTGFFVYFDTTRNKWCVNSNNYVNGNMEYQSLTQLNSSASQLYLSTSGYLEHWTVLTVTL